MVIQLPWNAGNPFHFPPPIAFVDTLRGYLHRAVFGTKVTRGFIASLKSLRGWKIRKRRRWNLRLFKIQNGRVQVFELKEPFIVSGEKWKITNGIFLFFFLLFLHFLLMNSLWTGRKKTRKNFRGTLTSFRQGIEGKVRFQKRRKIRNSIKVKRGKYEARRPFLLAGGQFGRKSFSSIVQSPE